MKKNHVNETTKNIALIFGGGKGSRVNGAPIPKQFVKIEDKPIIIHTIEKFQDNDNIDLIYLVCVSDWIDFLKDEIAKYDMTKVAGIVPGGDSAMASIYKGLSLIKSQNNDNDYVLIHDAVRPLVDENTIDRTIELAMIKGNAIACSPCEETIIIANNTTNTISEVPMRKNMMAARAPQTFVLGDVLDNFKSTADSHDGFDNIVDSCTLYKNSGKEIHITESNRSNIKITTAEDLHYFATFLQKGSFHE